MAVGVVRNHQHQILIAQRQPGVHLAGCWEFPGGKVEPGESVRDALQRELREELGIEARTASPLIQVDHVYPERRVVLDVWSVPSFDGDPRGLQGQALRWIDPEELPRIAFPAANRPIAMAARLPEYYAILDSASDNQATLDVSLQRLSARGLRLVQLRAKGWSDSGRFRAHAVRAIKWCRERGIVLLLNAQHRLAIELGADGVHLSSVRLMELRERPVPAACWLAASCHDLAELQHAERIGVDFAVLSPVARTLTHPNAPVLGWPVFARLVAQVNLPVYALGGLAPVDLSDARTAGAQGIAAIRGFLSDLHQDEAT